MTGAGLSIVAVAQIGGKHATVSEMLTVRLFLCEKLDGRPGHRVGEEFLDPMPTVTSCQPTGSSALTSPPLGR